MAVAEHEQATTDKPCACLPLPALSRPQLCRCAVPAAYSRPSLPPSRPRARGNEKGNREEGAPRRGEACGFMKQNRAGPGSYPVRALSMCVGGGPSALPFVNDG
jgi:hypothetical protein